MPVKVYIDGKEQWLEPRTNWQSIPSFGKELSIDSDFYVGSNRLLE
jgi:hypothetical protein